MNRRKVLIAAVAFTFLLNALSARTNVKRKMSLSKDSWKLSQWNKADGTFENVSDKPSGSDSETLKIGVVYKKGGFQHCTLNPLSAKIPGRCKEVSFWAKKEKNSGESWALGFKDAQDRSKVNNKKLNCPIKTNNGKWKKVSFKIPSDWEQPISINGIIGHNWNTKGKATTPSILINNLEVTSDTSAVENKDSLLKINLSTRVENNVFAENEVPEYMLSIDSWLGQNITGKYGCKIEDMNGKVVSKKQNNFSFDGKYSKNIKLPVKKFGVYKLKIMLKLSNGKKFKNESNFAYLHKAYNLTEKEKYLSPWAINIHGGKVDVPYMALAKIGFNWVRDYAYSLDWMVRSRQKGVQGKYDHWPWYYKMDKKIKDSGLILLPIIMHSISRLKENNVIKPDNQWKRDISHITMAFPDYAAWEIDNEYDLHNIKVEKEIGWKRYRNAHKTFSDIVNLNTNGALTVENGQAGIHPERTEKHIKSGAFDNINVVNAHFYCGTEAPEINKRNFNKGGGNTALITIYDKLRGFADAADCDGKDRQAWITEFGWDTLAGHIVSEKTQAAYLQRGFMMGLEAGIDKMFWYWDTDTKKVPNNFFDGCGIFNPKNEPKPVVAAASAMFHFLKLPKAVGSFDLGENSLGYVFETKGKFTAAAFKIEPDGKDNSAVFKNGKTYDTFGNPISNKVKKLDINPVWIVGIPKSDPMYLETAFDLKTKYIETITAGDNFTIELRTRNNRDAVINAQYAVKIPENWKLKNKSGEISTATGKENITPITVKVSDDAEDSMESVFIKVSDKDTSKILKTEFQVLAPASAETVMAEGFSGDTVDLPVTVLNNSKKKKSFTVKPVVPSDWNITPSEKQLVDIPGEGEKTAIFKLSWTNNWKPGEKAIVNIYSDEQQRVVSSSGIHPNSIQIPKVSNIKMDGKMSEWPKSAKIPTWALGTFNMKEKPELYMGYSEKGLYIAAELKGSKAKVNDPKWFWAQDCLEIFLDSDNSKSKRKYEPTDHQFWFCPLVEEKRVYAGRWKRHSEISATRYDLDGIDSFSKKTEDGFIIELFIPSSKINGFKGQAGEKIGMNLNFTIPKSTGNGEIFWPISKKMNISEEPWNWGTIELK